MRIYAEMNNAQLVTTAVKLDQSQKEYKSKLDAVKAELQGRIVLYHFVQLILSTIRKLC